MIRPSSKLTALASVVLVAVAALAALAAIDASVSTALAQGEVGGDTAMRGFVSQLFLIGSMVLIFYFLLIRPQQKKAKELARMIAGVKKGDRVLTSGGMYGVVSAVKDDVIVLEIGKETKVDFAKSAIAAVVARD